MTKFVFFIINEVLVIFVTYVEENFGLLKLIIYNVPLYSDDGLTAW